VLEGFPRHAFSATFLDDVRKDGRAAVDGWPRFDVAAHLVAVAMRVDDGRHRLWCELLDLAQDWLTLSSELRVDDDDPVCADKDRCVSPSALEHEQVVLDLVDGYHLRSRLLDPALLLVSRHRQRQH